MITQFKGGADVIDSGKASAHKLYQEWISYRDELCHQELLDDLVINNINVERSSYHAGVGQVQVRTNIINIPETYCLYWERNNCIHSCWHLAPVPLARAERSLLILLFSTR